MRTSESIKELAGALAKAQAVMAGAKKDATNPHFRSKYADLASVWEACREALTKNGISVVQMGRSSTEDEVIVETRLCHTSGEWMEGELAVPVSKADAQGYGSAWTYARRYSLAAAVGVAPEDDDGNAAAAAKPTKAIPANVEGKDGFANMTADEKAMCENTAATATRLAKEGKNAWEYLDALEFDHETYLAVWSLLDAPTRRKIKEQKPEAALATQP